MGQEEILVIMMKTPDTWFNVEELSESLYTNKSSINNALKRMRKSRFIDYCRVRFNRNGRYIYHYKIGVGDDLGKFEDIKDAI